MALSRKNDTYTEADQIVICGFVVKTFLSLKKKKKCTVQTLTEIFSYSVEVESKWGKDIILSRTAGAYLSHIGENITQYAIFLFFFSSSV